MYACERARPASHVWFERVSRLMFGRALVGARGERGRFDWCLLFFGLHFQFFSLVFKRTHYKVIYYIFDQRRTCVMRSEVSIHLSYISCPVRSLTYIHWGEEETFVIGRINFLVLEILKFFICSLVLRVACVSCLIIII